MWTHTSNNLSCSDADAVIAITPEMDRKYIHRFLKINIQHPPSPKTYTGYTFKIDNPTITNIYPQEIIGQ